MPTLAQLFNHIVDMLFSAVVVIVVGRYTSWGRRAVGSALAIWLSKIVMHPLVPASLLAASAVAFMLKAPPNLVSLLLVLCLTWVIWKLVGDRLLGIGPRSREDV